MISYISIKNFAIIENSEVEFGEGLNIITGETGAGKSIVIEAVSLALGARADASYVRSGCDKAVVQLVGDIDGEEVIITREVSSAGKNLCKLNGEAVTLAQIGSVCRRLADIHGQYDHQSLLNPDYHIHLIDTYHSGDIAPVKALTAELYGSYRQLSQKLSDLTSNAAENARKRDFMRFQLDEIEAAHLTEGEDELLAERISVLENSEKIYQNLSAAYEMAYDGSPSAQSLLDRISGELSGISQYSEALDSLSRRISDIYYSLEDAAREIRQQREKIVFSPQELDDAIARMETIEGLKRKYGGSISAVLGFAEQLSRDLEEAENFDGLKLDLESRLAEVTEKLRLACQRLTALRRGSAAELTDKIIEQLKDLNFGNSELKIEFSPLPDFTENGMDQVLFLISTNKGEPLKPLSKIASGGEMSRIMLAFKKIVADYDGIPTLIFDEIDTGISGVTASIVGRKLREIAANHQIICITHLPQIAACGHRNYRIEKSTDEVSTHTAITPLDDDAAVSEIARLLGGANITDTTLQSARELLAASR